MAKIVRIVLNEVYCASPWPSFTLSEKTVVLASSWFYCEH